IITNGSTNGKTASSTLPTGMYGALDSVRSPAASHNSSAALVPAAPISNPQRTVPLTLDDIPGGRSLQMQWRYLRVVTFSAWLFIRLLLIQVYVRRYFPRWVERTNTARYIGYTREFRGFAVALGGVFIKLGQFVSTRVDALPEAIVRELESLQDEVPTVPFKQIKRTLEQDLGALSTHFRDFNETPIAAASLGQAHKARLLNGDKVVVKVQRPGIREVCYTDLAALKLVAWVSMKFAFISRRADAAALTEEFGRVLLEELSYSHEALNAAVFADFFKDDMGVYIPTIYTAHSTDRILTLEDVSSLKITDFEGLAAAGISRKAVAQRLMDTYLRQIFEQFFFHADPHPGNLFIYPLPVDDATPYIQRGEGRPFYLIFIDFGMTGRLTRDIADGMVNTLQAVLARDAKRLVYGYRDLGFILPNADLDRIIESAEVAFNEVWGMSMTEIRDMDFDRAANLANEFSDLIKTMPFYIPQDFIYLGRTISILSGMCTTLDTSFNPWSELEPYAQRLAAQGFGLDVSLSGGQLTGGAVLQSLLNGGGSQALSLLQREVLRRANPLTPANEIIEKLKAGEIRVIAEPSASYRVQLKRIELQSKTTNRAIVFGSVLVASTLLYTAGEGGLALLGYGFCAAQMVYGWVKG
ncbi:MAG: AarF/ABC1/UbiB kinase family protein, partial [Armatimonadetes bacterium]|nr:AarF/ABC1/UbiB kinase family protein [Anaerolineae bacterium]